MVLMRDVEVSAWRVLDSSSFADYLLPDLPVPMLPVLDAPIMILLGPADMAAKPPQLPRTTSQAKSPAKPRNIRKDSLEDADADPWGSPVMHKGHNHDSGSRTNGTSRSEVNGISAPVRTTSNFTTTSIDESTN